MLFSGRKFKVEEREQMQAWMDEIYGVFKGHVVAGRGDRLKKPIDDIAGGRVFTGKQALEIGLIDEIGTLKDAIEFAAANAKAKDYESCRYCRVRPIRWRRCSATWPPGRREEDENKHLELPGGDGVGIQTTAVESDPLVKQVLPLLQGLDPQRTKLVLQALQQLDQVQQERAVLAMPGVLVE